MTTLDRLLKSAPAAIRSRGQDLFQRNKVSLVKEDASHNAFLFYVRGSYEPYYEVDIDLGLAGEEAEVNCTCPYFEGSDAVCKHIVASLLYLKQHSKLTTAGQVITTLLPTLQKVLSIAAKPSAKEKQPILVKVPASGKAHPQMFLKPLRNDYKAQQLVAAELQIQPDVFQAELLDRYGYYKPVPVSASISWKDGSYLFACSDKTHKGLCEHIHWLALFVSLHDEQNVLELVKKEHQEEMLQKLLTEFQAERPPKAKLQELLTHVQEKTGRHKLLVFSQFVKMLQLVEEQFKKLDIPYEYLDGQTTLKEREKRVQRFQDDPDRRVFLISLKAGGTGLNLTAADYVYIVDPWWNPAVENQAIDRCYRMGQEKKVFAYRMICKDTVEEKIIQLQEQKKLLSDELVSSGEGVMKKLSKEDIVALFS